MGRVARVEAVRCKQFSCTQSRYEHVPSLPLRACLYGPGGSGKTHLLVNLVLDVYRGCFERVYIFSPSVNLDHVWEPAKRYVEAELGVDPRKEPFAFDHYDPAALAEIVRRQTELADLMKRRGRHVYGVLVIIDDFADNPKFCRNEQLVHQLFVRGRHSFISTVVSSQKVVAVAPIVRVNATALFVFRLRCYQDLETFLDEAAALVESKKELLAIYRVATAQPHSFLYVDLTAPDPQHMFYLKFEARIVIPD